jgi:hypothetical protein
MSTFEDALLEEKDRLTKRLEAIEVFLSDGGSTKRKGKKGKRGPMSQISKDKMKAAWVIRNAKKEKEAKEKEKESKGKTIKGKPAE